MANQAQRQAWVFYGLTMALAVAVRLAVPWIGEASLMLTMLTPAVAVAILLIGDRSAPIAGSVLRDIGLAPSGLKAWPLAIGGPALIHAAGLLILVAAGLTQLVAPQISGSAGVIAAKLAAALAFSTLLALGEEVGWRGYLLPRLMGFGAVTAMLVVGLMHGIWHLPLMLTTDYYHSTGNPWLVTPLFLLTVTLAGIFYGFLRLWTGSVWPVALAHAAANMAWNLGSEASVTKSAAVLEYVGGESGIIMICGLVLFNIVLVRLLPRLIRA